MSVFQQFFGAATPIVNQTNAGSNSLVSQIGSGGGGGGSAGPNPVVSTITFTGGNQTTNGVISMSSILTINDSATQVIQDFIFNTNFIISDPGSWSKISSFTSTPNVFQVNGQAGNAATGQLLCFGGSDGRCGIAATNGGGDLSKLNLVGSSVDVPYDLTVSSINGQLPVGVAPAGISTNQVAAATSTALTLYADANTNINLESAKGGIINISANSGLGAITLSAASIATMPNCDLTISSINGQAPPLIQSGTVPNVGGTTGFVSFPITFNTVPSVVLTPEYDPAAGTSIYISSGGITKSLVNVVAGPTPGTSVIPPFSWIAIGT